MNRTTGGRSFLDQWWRIGGAAGIAWAVLFIIGAFVLQGEPPAVDDPPAEIREYFVDDAEMYLAGDFLLGIGFAIFLFTFVVIFSSLLGRAEGEPRIRSRLFYGGGILTVTLGAVAGIFWGALALGAAENASDETLVVLMDLDEYAFTLPSLGLAVMLLGAGLAILRTRVVWFWLGWLALAGTVLHIIEAAWTIDGDSEGFLGIVGFIGFIVSALWVIISSVALLMLKSPDPVVIAPSTGPPAAAAPAA